MTQLFEETSVEKTRRPNAQIDNEAVRRERTLSLRRSRADHLGYFNRLFKDIELLMRNAENYFWIRGKKKDVDVAFGKCFRVYDEYYPAVDNPEEKSEALNDCLSVISGKTKFDGRYEELIRSVQGMMNESPKEKKMTSMYVLFLKHIFQPRYPMR